MSHKQPKKKNSPAAGAGCLLLFALPFAGGGLFMCWLYVNAVALWADAAGWDQTQATLASVELSRHRGDESTTYRVEAEYDYEHRGKTYHGRRVGLFTGSDNIGRYQREMYHRLRDAKQQGRAVACYVDPDNPERSLLDRQMRLGLLALHLSLAVLFSGAGVGMLASGLTALRRERAEKRLARQHPNEPWRWKPEWRAGVIRHHGLGKALGLLLFAVWFAALAASAVYVALDTERGGVIPTLVIYGFAAAAAGLLMHACFELWRSLRYGASLLQLADTPGVIGGRLTGVLLIPARVPAEEGYLVRLLCQQRSIGRSGGKSRSTTRTLWEGERLVTRTLDSGDPAKTAVPIDFVIPSDARATETKEKSSIVWTIKVTADTPGPDYRASFEAPVFLTDKSQDGVTDDDQPTGADEQAPPLASVVAQDRLRADHSAPSRLTVETPPLRSLQPALPLAVVGLIMILLAALLFTEGQWLFVAVFTPIGALCLFVAIGLLIGASRLAIDGDAWAASAGWLGLRRTRRFRSDQIRKIHAVTTLQGSSSSGEAYRWARIVADLTEGRTATLVTGIRSRRVEQALLDELRQRAGLNQERADAPRGEPTGWDGVMELPAEEPL